MSNQNSILIVEDEDVLADLYEKRLRAAGHNVVRARSYAEAMLALQQGYFQVALVDMVLNITDTSNRDGLLVLRRIVSSNDGTACIFVTGYGGLEEGAQAAEAGAWKVVDRANLRIPELPALVENALASVRSTPRPGGGFLELFARDSPLNLWTDKVLRILQPENGVTGFNKIIEALLQPFEPYAESSLGGASDTTADPPALSAMLWSRRLACCLYIIIVRRREGDTMKSSEKAVSQAGNEVDRLQLLVEHEGSRGICGRTFRINDLPFEGFRRADNVLKLREAALRQTL